MGTWNLRGRLPRPREVPSESLLEDMNAALLTIPTATITRTNELVYTAATVILEMLGYTIKTKNSPPAPWKMRLEAKIKTTRREVSQLGEIQKSVELKNKTRLLGKYKGLSPLEALETAKQRLAALANRLRRYTKDAETKKINALFSKEPSKVPAPVQNHRKTRATKTRNRMVLVDYKGRWKDT